METAPVGDARDMYNEAIQLASDGEHEKSVQKFEMVEREHPGSDIAIQATVQKAYVLYLDGNFDIAIVTIEGFIQNHPAHFIVPYMLYLKALCYYDQILDVGRDQALAGEAMAAFQSLLNSYPNTEYTKDAKFKLDYIHNVLAGKEMEIGRFYLKQKAMVAALGRFSTVVEKYQTTILIEEALYRMVEIYYALGDMTQAERYCAVLGYNYPNSMWYERAFNVLKGNALDVKK